MIIKGKYFWLKLLVLILLNFSFIQKIDGQNLTEDEVKAIYIYNFAKEIKWPNIKEIDTFRIAILSTENNLYSVLKKLEKQRKIWAKPVRVYLSSDLKTLMKLNPQILYVSNEFNPQIKSIYVEIYNKPILLVTDQLDKFIYTMINFYPQDNKIYFKVNKENLKIAGLEPSDNLLIYGGSSYDIIEMFRQKENELKTAQKSLEIQRRKLDSLQHLYAMQESTYNVLKQQYQAALRQKEDSVQRVKHNLDSLLKLEYQREKLLNLSKDQLLLTQKQIEQFKDKINRQRKFYTEQLKVIERNKKIIAAQQASLNRYQKVVEVQRRRIIYLIIIIFLLIVSSTIIIIIYIDNRRLAKELEKRNKEIAAQSEEQAQLIEELERLSIVARETDNVVYIINPDGKIIWVNEALQRKYNIPLFEVIGKSFTEVRTLGGTIAIEFFDKCIEQRSSIVYETSFYLTEKQEKWIQVTLTPIIEDGQLTYVVAIDSDITNLKQALKKIEVINKMLLEQQSLLIAQKREIEEKNKVIQSSLEYALTIQNAVLPSETILTKYFSDYFLIFKPMQIVSGDFYWFNEPQGPDDYMYLVVADGTGHGVPGAFISLITERLLHEAIYMLNIKEPKDILRFLDQEIDRLILHNKNTENPMTGVDLVLLRFKKINPEEYQVTFSGAKRPVVFYLPAASDLEYYRTNRRSISNPVQIKYDSDYDQKTIIVPKDTVFYLYTDGYVDQNCYKTNKRIGTKNFLTMLLHIRNLPLKKQKQILEDYLSICLTNQSQRDDITILAVKL